jgi:NifU-like protein
MMHEDMPRRYTLLDRRMRPVGAPITQPMPRPVPAISSTGTRFNAEDRIADIEAVLAEVRPRLQADGGDCKLIRVEGNSIHVKMTGACVDCQLASMTVSGVQAKLMERLNMPVRVIPTK